MTHPNDFWAGLIRDNHQQEETVETAADIAWMLVAIVVGIVGIFIWDAVLNGGVANG